MSLAAMLWVFEHSEATLGARLVLLVLADYGHDDGTKCFPEVETIARKTRMSRKGVQLALRRLEADGLIVQTGTRPSGTKVYSIVMDTASLGGVETTPLEGEGGEDDGAEGAKLPTRGGVVATPDPPGTLEQDPPLTARVPKQIDRKPVTVEEAERAARILAEWNQQAGQNLSSPDWLSKIVMRIREYPALEVEGHARVIAYALAHPWWKGNATPSVVYGSGAQFERSIVAADAPRNGEAPGRYGRGLTTRQTAELFGIEDELVQR